MMRGDWVKDTIGTAARALKQDVSYKDVAASRGKAIRAELAVTLYEQGRVQHVGMLGALKASSALRSSARD